MTGTVAGKPLYDQQGRVVTRVHPSRHVWLDQPLAECDRGHLFITDDACEGECPVRGQEALAGHSARNTPRRGPPRPLYGRA